MNATLPFAPTSSRSGQALGALGALALHAGVLLAALQCRPTLAREPVHITEVDLTPVALPEPPAPAPAEPAAPEPAAGAAPAKIDPRPRRAAVKPAPAAPPAAAGALHTAREDSPSPAEPVRFAVDAHGAAYGFGMVAAGGAPSAQAGGNGSQPAAPSAATAMKQAAERPQAFAEPPRLDELDPCRGFFPAGASADRGEVTVLLRIAADGAVSGVKVQRESPLSQGFGAAATRCLKAKRFVPAKAEDGRNVMAEAPVTVRFSR